jgi:class 3 adenylate cyclase
MHAGEVGFRGSDVNGLAVNIGTRICALADQGEVHVTRTAKELPAGSNFDFIDRGTHLPSRGFQTNGNSSPSDIHDPGLR